MSEPQPKRPRLQYEKCKYCRRDKKKCQPYPREWPQKCTRCIEKDLPCSENEISKGRARSIEETSTPIHTGGPHSNAEFDRVLECIYKAKWVRQLGTHLKFVQSVNENYGIRQDILPPGSMTFGKFTNLVRCAQAKLANEAEELSKTLEENGRIAEAMLVSNLVDEGWGSHFLPCSAPLYYNIDLLRALIDRSDRRRDFATAETLQRTLVKSMLQGEGGLDVVKEIDRLQSLHAKYAAGLATFLEGWQININPLLLIPPISHYVDLLYPPFIRTLVDRHTQLLSETDCWGRTVLHVVLDGLATASLWHLESDLEQLLQDPPVHRKDIFGRTPLHAVCQNKLTECERFVAQRCVKRIVNLLLGCGDVEPNAEDINGRTPLSYAAENGHEEIVELLLEHGNIMVNTKDICGTAPLSYAAQKGHKRIVKLLLEHKNIDVNIANHYRCTPLLSAAARGDEGIVKLLLHKNVDANIGDKNGRTPLSLARMGGHEGIVKLLQSRIPSQNGP